LDHERDEEIEEKLKVGPIEEKLRRYKSNWLRQVTTTNNNRVSKLMLNCKPNGRRRLAIPLKRLLDGSKQVYQGLTGDG